MNGILGTHATGPVRFEIVQGVARDGYTPVWRVVEYRGDACLGGRGSYFRRADAERFIAEQLGG